jgi:NADP-dependent 3-hydroxy acid dehydrogenase YdfG
MLGAVMSGVKGAVVVVTGASSGIGEATAVHLAERGAKLILGARGARKLKTVADRIVEAGGVALYKDMNVAKREDVASLVKMACDRFGKLDVMFNNAGVMPNSPLKDLKVDDWELMVDVNIKGVLFGIAAAMPVFLKQGFGHMINTGSTAGMLTKPTQTIYSGTKFAVRAISDGLRQEAAGKFRVTVISPGFVNTSFADSISDGETKKQLEKSRDEFAMPPETIARAIAYAIDQPDDVNVGEIIIRSTAQA